MLKLFKNENRDPNIAFIQFNDFLLAGRPANSPGGSRSSHDR